MQPGDLIGTSAALDGDTAVVGGWGVAAWPTLAYVFVRNGTGWTEQAELMPSDNQWWGFGLFSSHPIMGDTVAVGSASLQHGYVFTRVSGSWTEQQVLASVGDLGFGEAVALGEDILAVGATYDGPGSVRVFTRGGTTWSQAGRLAPSDGAQGDWFGTSLALTGGLIAVGAPLRDTALGPDSGAVYLFEPFSKGDLDGDLRTDLVLRHTPSGANVAWLMDGSTRLGDAVPLTPTPTLATQQIVAVDDFDSDGHNDLAMWEAATGRLEFWLMNGATRVAIAPLQGAASPPAHWRPVAAVDFDRDLKPDIAWHDTVSEKLVVWLMNGTTRIDTVAPVPDHAVDGNWDLAGALDCDGDGHTDLLWRNLASGKLVQWLMDRNLHKLSGRFTNPPVPLNVNWQAAVGAELARGWIAGPEMVWRNRDSGRYVVWHLDESGARTGAEFLSPAAPEVDPLDWTLVGPR